jgi:hypothetical protein
MPRLPIWPVAKPLDDRPAKRGIKEDIVWPGWGLSSYRGVLKTESSECLLFNYTSAEEEPNRHRPLAVSQTETRLSNCETASGRSALSLTETLLPPAGALLHRPSGLDLKFWSGGSQRLILFLKQFRGHRYVEGVAEEPGIQDLAQVRSGRLCRGF